ncbi:DIS3-like exonuclease 2 [Blomia tropicalis]|nr:DIS3-like exonuclease 2 [Blomia tropicalis]
MPKTVTNCGIDRIKTPVPPNKCKATKPNRTNSTPNSSITPSKIPVYSLNKRLGSLDNFKPINNYTNLEERHSLSANQLAQLPESVKLMHMVHCYSNHKERTMPRSKTHDFNDMGGSSVPSTSATCSPGVFTPKERKFSNASTNKSSNSKANHSRNNCRTKQNKPYYDEYMPLCEMQKGLEKGDIIEGILRINPKNYNDAYISAPEGGLDIFIGGMRDRNRSLNGDLVLVQLNDSSKWTLSVSSLNSNWNQWMAEFESCLNNSSNENDDDHPLDAKKLKSLLNSQDAIKVEMGLKANKSISLKSILMTEFPNVPLKIYGMQMSDLMQIPVSSKFIQRTGKVVNLKSINHSRIVGGTIQLEKQKQFSNFKLIPNDCRIPHVMIPGKSLPKSFIDNYDLLKNNLFLVKIDNWSVQSLFPKGEILQTLGKSGDIESETEVVLKMYDIDTKEFPDEALEEYNLFSNETWKIPDEEYNYRKDLRDECVFTIDPQSARDLDDALSIRQLSRNIFEVGVHIADVSYFIKEKTMLNDIARSRATSVYLSNKVIPMLPPLFCQNLCSLNPGEDRLTFSILFTIDINGNIQDKWFGRTVINSCAKLSYEHAQRMIDSHNDEHLNSEEFPTIFNEWPLAEISDKVKALNRIAQNIRNSRFENGSLRLDKTKIGFLLNEDGMPISFSKYELKDSNRMIEEFMLLANKVVAERLYNHFSNDGRAFLRGHPPPNLHNLNEFISFCKNTNIDFNVENSISIYNSLKQLANNNPLHFRLCSINLIKSMKLAVYTCVNSTMSSHEFHHYALNFAKYTHFTSPIRRYADIIVHRLLATSLDYDTTCNDNRSDLVKVANNCNTRKYNAFLVSEKSTEIHLKSYIKLIGSIVTKAAVFNVYDHSFDVLILDFDIVCRVYLNQQMVKKFEFTKNNGVPQLKLYWQSSSSDSGEPNESTKFEQIISHLVQIDVQIMIDDKFNYVLVMANPEGHFIRAQYDKHSISNGHKDEEIEEMKTEDQS